MMRVKDKTVLVTASTRGIGQAIACRIAELGAEVIIVDIRDQYHNLADVVTLPENAHLIDNARAAFEACGVTPYTTPMRGGTDGSQLSFRGLPCVNVSGCYYNAHGVREFAPVPELGKMADVLVELVARYAVPQ